MAVATWAAIVVGMKIVDTTIEFVKKHYPKGSHRLEDGEMKEGQTVLKKYIRSKDWNSIEDHEYVEARGKKIKFVGCWDHWTDRTGPDFKIVSGGVGYDHVKIEILPKRNWWTVGVFGRGYSVTILVTGDE